LPFLEAILGVAAILLLGWLVPGHWGLLGLQPHPLWLVVVAIALRYGPPAGYLAGALSGAAYWFLVWASPQSRFEPVETSAMVEVFLMFLAGVLISEAVGAGHRRADYLEHQLQKYELDLEDLRRRNEQSTAVIGELQKRIVDKGASVANVRELAAMFSSSQPQSLHRALLHCLVKELGAEACALYLKGPDNHLQYTLGYPEILPGREKTADECGLVALALREGRVVTLRDLLQGPEGCTRNQSVMMAGPLRGSEDEVVGVVVVERMPLLKLTPTNVRLLEAIIDLCTQSLRRTMSSAHAYAPARHRMDVKEGSGAGPGEAHALR
jgi:hypothetical protein